MDILKNLKSPYLPQVFDFVQQGGDVYTVMDYIPGKSLKEVLSEQKNFPQKQVLKWMDQLCQAVEQLHTQEHPIIHGDIKPANIMLTPKDDICLIDFNISGDFEESDIIGFTPGYAAPEQMESVARRREHRKLQMQQGTVQTHAVAAENNLSVTVKEVGANSDDATVISNDATVVESELPEVESEDATEIDMAADEDAAPHSFAVPASDGLVSPAADALPQIQVDTRSDIYSIGATMYHLITGQCPDAEHVRPVEELAEHIEDSFAFLIMKCLERDPRKRYQSIQELHKAVLNVHKSSVQYRKLLFRQICIRLALIAGMIGFAALAGLGRVRMGQEKTEAYDGYVQAMATARESGDYDQAAACYQEAAALVPDGAGAALEMVRSLYQQKKYQDTVDFVERSVRDIVTDEQTLGEIFFLYGDSYLEMEKYDAAAEAFQQTLSYGFYNSQVYRDYAIALARLNRSEEASAQLEQAIQYRLTTDSVYYVRGEIYNTLEDWENAAASFRSCIGSTDNDYMKMRAYLMCSRALEQGAGTLEEQRALLEEARAALPMEYRNAILEELGQIYINLSDASDDPQYDLKAIEVFREIIEDGWGAYEEYHNIAVLYQKNQMYEEEKEILADMLERFGEDYRTYKRLAFMEAGAQVQRPGDDRDFAAFAEYYQKALSLYEEQLSGNQTDLEMSFLTELYRQAVEGGWITE